MVWWWPRYHSASHCKYLTASSGIIDTMVASACCINAMKKAIIFIVYIYIYYELTGAIIILGLCPKTVTITGMTLPPFCWRKILSKPRNNVSSLAAFRVHGYSNCRSIASVPIHNTIWCLAIIAASKCT